ncbi:hypothetical protein AB0C38_31825 [Amycolatopsis sp. NPDC048633]|uniref:hypothetical protein n=1 Tax=Amycolatopsis sp. NPDC048633 TaxID=3157095 RepID=UPI003406366F
MTARTRKPAVKHPAAKPVAPAEPEQQPPAPKNLEEIRRPDSRVEAVAVDECIVDGCPVLEFEPGRGLCMGHFTTRLDLREVARHD